MTKETSLLFASRRHQGAGIDAARKGSSKHIGKNHGGNSKGLFVMKVSTARRIPAVLDESYMPIYLDSFILYKLIPSVAPSKNKKATLCQLHDYFTPTQSTRSGIPNNFRK